MRYKIICCLLILVLTGCLHGYTPTPTNPLPGASKTPTPLQTVTPTVISTPTPTVTTRPSFTAVNSTPTTTVSPSHTAVIPTPTTCSPSYLQLTYITELSSGNYGVYAIEIGNLDAQQPCFGESKLLFQTQFRIHFITWSPNGKRIAFVGLGENNTDNIFVADWDGQNLTNITNTPKGEGAGFPVWSLDGKKIAYIYEGEFIHTHVRISDPDGKNVTQITWKDTYPKRFYWIPGSNNIAYIVDYPSCIIIGDINGTILYQFPQDTSHFIDYIDLTFSPSGQRLAVNAEKYSEEGLSMVDLYVVNIDGSGEINLTNGMDTNLAPQWSPLFDWIAFETNPDGLYNIYLIKPDGTQRIQVTHGSNDIVDPAWRYVGSP